MFRTRLEVAREVEQHGVAAEADEAPAHGQRVLEDGAAGAVVVGLGLGLGRDLQRELLGGEADPGRRLTLEEVAVDARAERERALEEGAPLADGLVGLAAPRRAAGERVGRGDGLRVVPERRGIGAELGPSPSSMWRRTEGKSRSEDCK